MKARLLHRDQDFDARSPLPWQAEALTKDLELTTLFNAMAQGDEFVFEIAGKVILAGFVKDMETIRYRQDILQDCLNHPAAVRELYALAVETTEAARKQYLGFLDRYPDSVLRHSIEHMETLVGLLRKLRKFADSHADKFPSEGWAAFFTRLKQELSDEYVAGIESHLEQLKFRGGIVLSAELGSGNKGTRYLLHRPPPWRKGTWLTLLIEWLEEFFPELAQLFKRQPPTAFSFSIHPRDESGARALAELRNRGIGLAANALAQSADHVRSFFSALRTELAFYIGCLNLRQELARKKVPVCVASPVAMEERRLSFQGVYDVCLALHLDKGIVGNDANADGKDLMLITGANQGGKSTLLRAVGLAQLMMQCGMFVPADWFRSSVCDSLFTHYKREEDIGMKSGKLDEELSRMSDIVDHITPHSMILLNESFAATNEREGSEIARQIITALMEKRITVICVTHLYELARGFHDRNRENILFLRAERERTFRLIEGEPLQTSFGEDLYKTVFGVGIDL